MKSQQNPCFFRTKSLGFRVGSGLQNMVWGVGERELGGFMKRVPL